MAAFELIVCIIAAVVLSSFLSRFIPKVSTPLVQIALGALASQLPFFPNVTLDPELFMVLFIAPLLYLEAHEIDKSELLKSVTLSLSLAIGLAIATMVAVGFALHAVWPAIPLAAALALGAALDRPTRSPYRRSARKPRLRNVKPACLKANRYSTTRPASSASSSRSRRPSVACLQWAIRPHSSCSHSSAAPFSAWQ